MPEPLQPTPLCSSAAARRLAGYYEKHGESHHVGEVERALTDEWQPTDALLKSIGKSITWGRNALEYLALHGRAERGTEEMPERLIYGKLCNWRYVWRRPQPLPDEPVLLPY